MSIAIPSSSTARSGAELGYPTGQPLGEAATLLWNGTCFRSQGPWYLTRPWAAVQEPPLAVEAPINPCALHLIADFDGDGIVDILGSPEGIETGIETDYYGLALWRLDASGGWTRDSLLDWKVLPSVATASDLNGDGVLDVALVAANSTIGPALAVLLRPAQNGVPVLEGYYPLPGEGSQVLTGDVNGDGDTDLVVLGKSPGSDNGGVFVLLNQGTPATAIASETGDHADSLYFRCQLSQPVQPGHDHPLSRARRSQGRGLDHLQHARAADAPSVDGAAVRW